MVKRYTAIIFLLLILFSNKSLAQCGKVLEVKDGDTFVILLDQNQKQRIRLAFIDAPEHQQDFGEQSKKYLTQLIGDRKVCLDVKYMDPYKRLVAVVKLGKGKVINEEMLSSGMAWHFVKYSKDIHLAMLEMHARKAKKGVWATTNPVAPWVFRKQHHIGFPRKH